MQLRHSMTAIWRQLMERTHWAGPAKEATNRDDVPHSCSTQAQTRQTSEESLQHPDLSCVLLAVLDDSWARRHRDTKRTKRTHLDTIDREHTIVGIRRFVCRVLRERERLKIPTKNPGWSPNHCSVHCIHLLSLVSQLRERKGTKELPRANVDAPTKTHEHGNKYTQLTGLWRAFTRLTRWPIGCIVNSPQLILPLLSDLKC